MNGTGIVPQTDSLADRVRRSTGRPIGPLQQSVDTGGLSGGGGPSPISQSPYDRYSPAVRPAQQPSRLIQRINPVTVGRGGTRKEYEGG